MMLTIFPASSWKLTRLMAVRPPKDLTILIVSSSAIFFLLFTCHLIVSESPLPPLSRDQPFGAEDHHQDEDQAEEQALVFGRVQLGGQILPGKVNERDNRLALAQLA